MNDLPGDSIESCIISNHELRQMRERRYLSVQHYGSPYGIYPTKSDGLAIRGYVFAFEGRGAVAGDICALADRIREVSRNPAHPAHLHGVFVGDVGFLYTVPSAPDANPAITHTVNFTANHPLLTFKATMLRQLATFPRPDPESFIDMAQYFDYLPDWNYTLDEEDVGFAKLCRRAQVPVPGRGYWARLEVGQPLNRPPLPDAPSGLPELLRIRGKLAVLSTLMSSAT